MSDGCTRAVEVCTSTRGVNGVSCVSPPCLVTPDQRLRDPGRFTVEEPADAGASMSLGLVGVVALVISDSAGGAGVRCRPSGTIWSVGRNETLTGDDGFASTALVVAVAAEAFAVFGSTAAAAHGGAVATSHSSGFADAIAGLTGHLGDDRLHVLFDAVHSQSQGWL